jgi:hypothetical protein
MVYLLVEESGAPGEKPQNCRKLLTNFIIYCCIEYTSRRGNIVESGIKHHKLYTVHLIPFVYNLGWPDLQNEVRMVQKKEIRFSSKKDVTRISENHKVNFKKSPFSCPVTENFI